MFGGRFDDADVGLMGDEQIDVAGRQPGALQRVITGVRHGQDRGLEDFAARHLDVITVILEQLFTRRVRRPAAGPIQQLGERAVRLQIDRQDPAAVRAFANDRRTRAVAEQDRRGAVAPIHDAGELLGGDHEHVFGLLGRDDALGGAERKDEPRAGGADVERRRILGAKNGLEIARLRRQQPVG